MASADWRKANEADITSDHRNGDLKPELLSLAEETPLGEPVRHVENTAKVFIITFPIAADVPALLNIESALFDRLSSGTRILREWHERYSGENLHACRLEVTQPHGSRHRTSDPECSYIKKCNGLTNRLLICRALCNSIRVLITSLRKSLTAH